MELVRAHHLVSKTREVWCWQVPVFLWVFQWRRKRINKISGSEVDQPDRKFVDVNRAEKGKIINVVRKIKTKEEKHIDPNI